MIRAVPSSDISLEEIQADSTSWFPFRPESHVFDSDSVYWGKISIQNNSTQRVEGILFPDRGLALDGNGVVTAYIIRQNKSIEKQVTGRMVPYYERSLHLSVSNHIRLNFEEKERIMVFFQIYQVSHVPPVFDLLLESPETVQRITERSRIIQSFFQGMLWIMILFSLLIYAGSRDFSYILYVFYLFFTSMFFLYRTGYFVDLFLRLNPEWQLVLWALSLNMLIITYLQFVRGFVNTREIIPKWDKFGHWWVLLVLAMMVIELLVIGLFFHEGMLNFLIDGTIGLSALFLLIICIRFFRTKEILGRVMIFGSLFLVFGGVIGIIADIFFEVEDILPIIEVAFVAEVLTFSLGLGIRENLSRNQRLNEQKIMNRQLRQTDRLKDQFLANTSHELKTPLNGIIGIAESLLDEFKTFTPAAIKENLKIVISSSRRLESLVNDILDFEHIKHEQVRINQRPTDLFSMVDIVFKINQPLVKGRELVLENTISPDLSSVYADEERIQQIFHNLVGNAVKFTETGSITVGASEKDGKVEVWVRDTGTGIPESKRHAIFEEFVQVDGTTEREFAGTGLGLSISKKLVELHGGQMWVESELDVGSTFFFTLPVSTVKAKVKDIVEPRLSKVQAYAGESDSPDDKTALVEPAAESFRILVVDDETINHQVLYNHLRGRGFRIVKAMNGGEALEFIYSDDVFDLVLLDVMMPKMSGFEVCQRIRKKYLASELPVIFITAKNQVTDLVQGLTFGGNDYISKPFTKSEFSLV